MATITGSRNDNNFMGSGKSYEQYSYEKNLTSSGWNPTTQTFNRSASGNMDYGTIPMRPGQTWNEWQQENKNFQDQNYSGVGLKTGRSAANFQNNPSGISGIGKIGSSYGASLGGGGGGNMMLNPLAGIDFYNPNTPKLQGVTEDFSQANKPYQEQASQALPDYMSVVKSQLSAAKQAASGQMSKGLAGNIARGAAQAGLGTGLMGSGLQRNRTARDFGQTSEDLIARSVGLLQGAAQGYQNFFNVSNPISPNYLFEAGVNKSYYNTGIANQQAQMNFMNTANPGQFDISKGAFVGFKPGTYSSSRPQVQTGTKTEYKYKDAYGKGYGSSKQVPVYSGDWYTASGNKLGV